MSATGRHQMTPPTGLPGHSVFQESLFRIPNVLVHAATRLVLTKRCFHHL